MGLFEILFIVLFILVPIIEQVKKRGDKGKEAPGPRAPGRDVPEREVPHRDVPGPQPTKTRPGEVGRGSTQRESEQAADMVPDDLWAILTGEERPRDRAEVDEEELTPTEPAAKEDSPEEAPARWEEAWTPRPEPRWRMDDVEEEPAPASLEHHGPEAYSLETFEREQVSLEKPLESPETRHRRFHEIIDRPPPRRRTRRSPIGRALQSPESLRQAFVLSEVLGTPKGLE